MQINPFLNPSALYGTNPVRPQAQPTSPAQDQSFNKIDKAVSVAISPEAQALQKAAAARKAASTGANDKQATEQHRQQGLQAQRPAGQAPARIDIAV